jgi:hypothetical protein
MNLDQMTTNGCTKAMEACVARLRVIGWANADISHHAAELTARLRVACKACLDNAVRDFADAMKSGMSGYAVPTFYATFANAGIAVANEFDAAQSDEFHAEYAAACAVE